MAKGQKAKLEIQNKLLSSFEGAFLNEKEIRIPWIEDGENIQIKITLTAAKDNIEPNSGEVLPGETVTKPSLTAASINNGSTVTKPTEEEKENVARLMAMFNL